MKNSATLKFNSVCLHYCTIDPKVEIYTPGSDSSSNSEDIPPPPKQHHSPLEANAERFFRAKACVNLGKNKGGGVEHGHTSVIHL